MDKISICTVCMNRLMHLSETLPANIVENRSYPNVEFVILDYNSPDGMEQWVRANMMTHIESGVLQYYKTYEPKDFNLSHSKNMALKLASGDIIGLVDADNYAGPNYVDWVSSVYATASPKTVITTLSKDAIKYRDQGGKLCFPKEFFHLMNGFDESLVGYGIEDVDLINRMEKAGGKRVFIDSQHHLKFIPHSNTERLKNFHLLKNLENIYIAVQGRSSARVLYILRDLSFFEVVFEFSSKSKADWVTSYGGWSTHKDVIRRGTFIRADGKLSLTFDGMSPVVYKDEKSGFLLPIDPKDKTYWKNVDRADKLFLTAVMGYSECNNRFKSLENDRDNCPVNPGGWGKGVVYHNFDMENPIHVN